MLLKGKSIENPLKVGVAERKTGHIFTTNFELFLGEGEVYHYFESAKEAILFASNTVKEGPEFECWVSNHKDEIVYFKSIDEEKLY
jgi:hypothetical protein